MKPHLVSLFTAIVSIALCSRPAHAQSTLVLNEREIELRVRAASPSVRAQRAALAQSMAERDRAARALVPELSVTGRYTRLSSVPEAFRRLEIAIPGMPSMGDGLVFPQLLDQFTARATLTLALSELFTRALPALAAAGARTEALALEARAQQTRSVLEAQSAYLSWLRARAALDIAHSTRASFEQQRDDTARRVSAGQIAAAQQLPLDVTLSSLRRQELSIEATVRIAEAQLRALLALRDERIVPGDETDEPSPSPRNEPVQRPELAALDANARALESQTRATAGALAPALHVIGGVDLAAPNPRAFAQTTLTPLATWDVSVQLSWSLGQTLDAEAQLRVLSAQRDGLNAQREALSRAIEAEVTTARAELEAAVQRLAESQTGLRAAEALAAQRRGAYAAGVATATELTLAEAELLRQRIERADARLEARAAHLRVRYALGSLTR
ncbi:MAG: TolC family protein [Deltaproteobacteria bacterium]|nr:TolC family protein [Deltaproteobacteria bacterium]